MGERRKKWRKETEGGWVKREERRMEREESRWEKEGREEKAGESKVYWGKEVREEG